MELRIRNLSKTYANGVRALNDVTLTIPPGMFGLLGPNGAGKSTLMRTIATLQEPDRLDPLRRSVGPGDRRAPPEGPHARDARLPSAGVRGLPERDRRAPAGSFAVLKGITERRARKAIVEALLRQTNL